MVTGVCPCPSLRPHEEAGQNPFASSLDSRGRIRGQGELSSGTMTLIPSVGKEDLRMDERLNATAVVDDADAEKKRCFPSVTNPESELALL